MKKSLTLALSLCGAGLLLAGCGPKNEAKSSASAPAASPAASAPKAAAAAVVEITANDQMKFNVTRFEVTAGQDVTVTFTNTGNMPKAAMGHNLVILHKGVDPKAFADAAVMAMANDYIPKAKESEILAHTKMLGPKQSDELKFKAPSEPGEYPFICTFPAHFASGMKGVMVVK